MKLSQSILSVAMLFAVPVGMGVLVGEPRPAHAEEVILFPPAEFIATAQPEYYGGHAVYWYGSRWFYRDGRVWRYYRSEPAYLHERRIHWSERARYHYHR